MEDTADNELRQFAGIVPKIGAFVIGLVYLLGFLVVTFRVSLYGVSPPAAIRLQYILAGLWFLSPLVLIGCVVYATVVFGYCGPLFRAHKTEAQKVLRYRRISGSIQAILAFGGSSAVIVDLLRRLLGTSLHSTISVALRFAGLWALIVLFGILATSSMALLAGLVKMELPRSGEATPVLSPTARAVMNLLLSSALLVSFVVGTAWYFSVGIYAAIPSAFGGGKPKTVVFLMNEKSGALASSGSSSLRSVPYQLLLETDASYIVVSPTAAEKSIEIQRESVSGMVVLDQ